MSSNRLTASRQFELVSSQENAEALVDSLKKVHEADAQRELDEKMGDTLADFQTRSSWTVENANVSGVHLLYTLTMKVVFKP